MLLCWRSTGMLGVFGKSLLAECVKSPLTINSIEDNIVITKTGSENLTTVVKEVEAMERIINSS